MSLRALSLLALLTVSCASTPPVPMASAPSDEERLADAALTIAATQVRRCYRAPRVATEAKQIVTRLRIRLSADGQVAALPSVVLQDGVTPTNRPYAGRMAEAAIQAVIRCAPIRLPETFYREGWTEFDLTFSPLARG